MNSNNSPYKFNAKEFDAETGWYYYGARYYDPKWSLWLSVDAEYWKYPSYSPYNYTLQNPIRFIDPDGNSPDDIHLNDNGEVTHIERNNQPNRFFASDGTELFFNDSKNADSDMLNREFNVGDKVFNPIPLDDFRSMMRGAGFDPARYNIKASQALANGNTDEARANKALALASAAEKSLAYQPADFTKSQLEKRYGIPSGTGDRGFDNETAAYFRFGNSNNLYNWYDAGNKMWGGWMRLNGFKENEIILGSNLFEVSRFNFGDSQADQRAIRSGFLLTGYER